MSAIFRRTLALTICLLCLGAAALHGCSDKREVIRIATKPMTEQFVLGEMLAILIEQDLDVKVELTFGVGGGTANIHPALLLDDFDLYPEYTGTAWQYVLKRTDIPDDAELVGELVAEYDNLFNLRWVGFYGFNNSYGLAVRRELAQERALVTYSNLAPLSPSLVFGAEYDFYEREDGYDALCATYNFEFSKHLDMDIGLKYGAIKNKRIDVMTVFTTDGQIASGTVTVLKDDKRFYPTDYCGTVVRADSLLKHPDLEATLMKMDGLLTDNDMARLNYLVEVKGESPKKVAKSFLKNKGLVKD